MPFVSASAISPYNSIRGGASASSTLFLDSYTDAAAAFALIKLRTGYSGNCIKVRKTVGGTTTDQDIGFVNNVLDTAAIATFCGTADGFVSKKYDQSTNGNNQTQTEVGKQPKIYNGGTESINVLDSLPALLYPATTVTEFDTAIEVVSVFAIINSNTLRTFNQYVGGISGSSTTALANGGTFGTANGLTFIGGGQTALGNTENDSRVLCNVINSSTSLKMSINGNSLTTFTRTSGLQARFVGNREAAARDFLGLDGNIQFEAYFQNDQSSNFAGIQDFINSAYSIY